jgi:hypothetical protein
MLLALISLYSTFIEGFLQLFLGKTEADKHLQNSTAVNANTTATAVREHSSLHDFAPLFFFCASGFSEASAISISGMGRKILLCVPERSSSANSCRSDSKAKSAVGAALSFSVSLSASSVFSVSVESVVFLRIDGLLLNTA